MCSSGICDYYEVCQDEDGDKPVATDELGKDYNNARAQTKDPEIVCEMTGLVITQITRIQYD